MGNPTLAQRARLAWRATVGIFSPGSSQQVHGLLRGMWPGATGESPTRGARERIAAYADMPWVFALCDKVAYAFATVDWHVYVVRPKGSKKAVLDATLRDASGAKRRRLLKAAADRQELVEVADHQLVGALNAGNSILTGLGVRKVTSLHFDLEGETFWMKERDDFGVPVAFWPLPPNWVLSTPTPQHPYYRVSFRGWQGRIPDAEIAWLPNPNPSNPYGRGTGVVRALADELETDEYAAKSVRQTFFNQARPDFIVYPDQDDVIWNDAQRERLAMDWQQQHEGFWRVAKPRFATQKLGVHEFSQTDHRKLEMTKLREFERDLVRQTFGVPPEIMGIVEPGASRACHSEDTECLTRQGWKRHDQLTVADEVATWNELEERLEYHHPLQVVRYPYSGEMHHWTTRSVDVMVTPDHRMYVQTPSGKTSIRRSYELAGETTTMYWRATGGGYDGDRKMVSIPYVPRRFHLRRGKAKLTEANVREIRERAAAGETDVSIARSFGVTSANVGYIRRGQNWRMPEAREPYRFDSEVFASFLGYFVSEGSYYDHSDDSKDFGVRVGQNEGPIAEKIRRSMEALELAPVGEVRRPAKEPGVDHIIYHMSDPSLWHWLRREAGVGAADKKLPREVFDWPRTAQLALFDALMEGDGSKRQSRTKSQAPYADRYYGTISRQLADDVHQLCAQLGLRCAVKERYPMPPRRTAYVLTISSQQLVTVEPGAAKPERGQHLSVVPYDGVVWCVEVPGHLFFTRRNGKMILHSNTITRADYVFSKWVVEPRLEQFRALLQQRVVPEYDERIVVDYDSPIQDDKEYALEVTKEFPWVVSVDELRAMAQHPPLEGGGGELHGLPNIYSFGQLQEKDTATKTPPPGDGANKPKSPKRRALVIERGDDGLTRSVRIDEE